MDLKENLNKKAPVVTQQTKASELINYNQSILFQDNPYVGNKQDQEVTSSGNKQSTEALSNTEQLVANQKNQLSGSMLPIQQDMIINNVPQFEITIKEAKDRILQLQDFIRFMMVPNIDYGFIPNCPKPTLFKAGAEKRCDVYGLTKQIEVINRIEDFNQGLFHYEVKATLTNKRTGLVEAEGIGCCNNKEKKYINQDPFSIMNTVLKMAKKRALVDAVLSATRTSGIFSQDLETLNQNRAG
jgi:hypothetical protein